MTRGENSVRRFAHHILSKLNSPLPSTPGKTPPLEKPHWSTLPLRQLKNECNNEYEEFMRELYTVLYEKDDDKRRAAAVRLQEEAVDVAAQAMMIYDFASAQTGKHDA